MSEEEKEYIEHEIVDRLYCLEEKDFDKIKVTDDYIQAVIKAGKENKNLISNLQKELDKKDKVINQVIEEYVKSIITEKQFCPIINDKVKNCARYDLTCDICMKKYFYKKVEKENE